MSSLIIKRRFAVMLEDAILAPAPSPEELAGYVDLEDWAMTNYDRLYEEAKETAGFMPEEKKGKAELLWEDEHHADLDSFDDEFKVNPLEEA